MPELSVGEDSYGEVESDEGLEGIEIDDEEEYTYVVRRRRLTNKWCSLIDRGRSISL